MVFPPPDRDEKGSDMALGDLRWLAGFWADSGGFVRGNAWALAGGYEWGAGFGGLRSVFGMQTADELLIGIVKL